MPKTEIPIPEAVMPEINQAAANVQKAQAAFNKLCEIVLKSIGSQPKEGKVSVNFDKKCFEVECDSK